MRWLVRLIASLWLVSLLAVAGAVLAGRRQPPSGWAVLLHFGDCTLPCWIGIEPGRTTMQQARQQIQTVYADPAVYTLEKLDEFSYRLTYKPTTNRVRVGLGPVSRRAADAVVRAIDFEPVASPGGIDTPPTLPELYGDLGYPTSDAPLGQVKFPLFELMLQDGRVSAGVDQLECSSVVFELEIAWIRPGAAADEVERAPADAPTWNGQHPCRSVGWMPAP